jgi:hypothetical protein
MTNTFKTEHEWTVHSINIHGVFFERWCQHVVVEAEGWTLDSVNYPVEFPPANGPMRGKESALDIRASRIAGEQHLCLLIECKKNNPEFVDWVFFKKPNERTTNSFIVSQVENTPHPSPAQGWSTVSSVRHLTSSYLITDEARETRSNYLDLKNSGNKTKTSNAAIQDAAYQVTLAKQAVVHEDADVCRRLSGLSAGAFPPWKQKIYFPTIVTTARLFACTFDSKAVNPTTGEIQAADASIVECNTLVFEYSLPRHLQFAPLRVTDGYREGLVDLFTRQHILVVQSQFFPTFLHTFYGSNVPPLESSDPLVPSG